MPKKKTAAAKRKSTAKRASTPINLRAAIENGKSAGEEVVSFRARQRKKRATIEKNLPKRRLALAVRGFLGGFFKLPGPWLQPGFRKKGHDDLARNTVLIAQLIDRFNVMLAQVSAIPQFAHVRYVDLRGTLKRDGTYKKHWANELHPTALGFDLVTKKFALAINSL